MDEGLSESSGLADNPRMRRDDAIRILREHASEIRAEEVTRLALFGSTARDQARPDSDVDLLVD